MHSQILLLAVGCLLAITTLAQFTTNDNGNNANNGPDSFTNPDDSPFQTMAADSSGNGDDDETEPTADTFIDCTYVLETCSGPDDADPECSNWKDCFCDDPPDPFCERKLTFPMYLDRMVSTRSGWVDWQNDGINGLHGRNPIAGYGFTNLDRKRQHDDALRYARMVDPSMNDENWHLKSSQWRFHFWEAAVKLADYFRNTQWYDVPKFDSVLIWIGYWRNYVAIETAFDGNDVTDELFQEYAREYYKFGYILLSPLKTPISKKYGEKIVREPNMNVFSYINDVLADENSPLAAEERDFNAQERLKSYRLSSDRDVLNSYLSREFSENYCKYSTVLKLSSGQQKVAVYISNGFKFSSEFYWLVNSTATNDENFNPIISSAFNDVLRNRDTASDEEYYELVAKLHWFIINTAPFVRGTAALGEVLVASMLLLKNKLFTGWKDGYSGDITALCTQNFHYYQYLFQGQMKDPIQL